VSSGVAAWDRRSAGSSLTKFARHPLEGNEALADRDEPTPTVLAEPDDATTIKQLAVAGAATTLARSLGVRSIGLLLNVVLARILAPHDFGELALGLTIYIAFNVFANAGLGASLIRRADPPDQDDLATVFGAQLGLGLLGLAVVGGLATVFVTPPLILAALFLCTLPIQAPRTIALIHLERRLEYRRMAIVDVVDCLCQAVVAIVLVAAGMGVYGVALAQPLGVVAGTVLLLTWRVAPLRPPRVVRSRARSLFADGAMLGGGDAVNLVRDLTLNWGTAAIAGTSVLGIWAFTLRLAAIPSMMITALSQVTYSALPRLHAAGGSVQSVVIPTLRLTTLGIGAPVAVLAGCSPQLVPLVLGSKWADIIDVLPLTCLALLIAGPVSIASVGYLFAHGRVRRILTAQIAHSIVTVGLAFVLLPSLGVIALGISMCGGAVTDAAVLGTAALKGSNAGYLRAVGPPVVGSVAIGGASFSLAQSLQPSWALLVLFGIATLGAYGLAILAIARDDMRRMWGLIASKLARRTLTA
jgi:succinoglycan exporter